MCELRLRDDRCSDTARRSRCDNDNKGRMLTRASQYATIKRLTTEKEKKRKMVSFFTVTLSEFRVDHDERSTKRS